MGLQLLSELIGEGMKREGLNFNHNVIIGLFEVLLSFYHLVCLDITNQMRVSQIGFGHNSNLITF